MVALFDGGLIWFWFDGGLTVVALLWVSGDGGFLVLILDYDILDFDFAMDFGWILLWILDFDFGWILV